MSVPENKKRKTTKFTARKIDYSLEDVPEEAYPIFECTPDFCVFEIVIGRDKFMAYNFPLQALYWNPDITEAAMDFCDEKVDDTCGVSDSIAAVLNCSDINESKIMEEDVMEPYGYCYISAPQFELDASVERKRKIEEAAYRLQLYLRRMFSPTFFVIEPHFKSYFEQALRGSYKGEKILLSYWNDGEEGAEYLDVYQVDDFDMVKLYEDAELGELVEKR